MATNLHGNRQRTAPMFGQLPDEVHPTVVDRHVRRDSERAYQGNPWALQAFSDAATLMHLDRGRELLEEMEEK
eukprot:8843418-Pyramimonas_sp.AAC.1